MRRPSTEQNEDDLNRLTASASVRSSESVNSTQTVIKAINNNNNTNDNNNNSKNNSSNYLPNIIIASTEYQQQCRKRKDRQDSISSITQDRKVVRSSSEEHVPSCQDQSDAIRRVSSHEDFNNPLSLQEHNSNTENKDIKVISEHSIIVDEEIKIESYSKNNSIDISSATVTTSANLSPINTNELTDEHERRRDSERFLKTSGKKSPRRSRKSPSPTVIKEGEEMCRNEEAKENSKIVVDDDNFIENENEKNLPNSPVVSKPLYPWESLEDKPIVCPRFAENTFDHVHHSISKFVKHDHDLVKYNSTIDDDDDVVVPRYHHIDFSEKKHYRHDNFLNIENIKTHQKSHSPIFQTPDERIRQINKRLTSLKKKISAYEESFETNYGYRPSHADKSNDKNIKNYIAEIHKLRKEKSQIKSDPMTAMGYKNKFDDSIPVEKKMAKVKDSLEDIEKKLDEKRNEENRSSRLEDMTPDQLIEEKQSVQRALLYFESLFGRPGTPDERDAARPLYDRYRFLKRLVNRNNSISSGIPELPTILENEALALSGIVTPSTDFSPPSVHSAIQSPSDSSTSTSLEAGQALISSTTATTTFQENFQLHSMSVKELYCHFDTAREEKKQLRRTIKEFEHNFEEINGRKMLKSDRLLLDDTYTLYKEKKAKLRLLDALVKKQMSV